jgi:hypothetical protein
VTRRLAAAAVAVAPWFGAGGGAAGAAPPAADAAPAARAEPDAAPRVLRALGHVQLDHEQAREVSGLHWQRDGRLLLVTDRGWLLTAAPRLEGGRLVAATAGSAVRIGSGKKVNAESVTAVGDVIVVVDEAEAAAIDIDAQGRELRRRTLADAQGPAAARSSGGDRGVEAIAHHPVHGLLWALQRPRRGDPTDRHTVHADDGRRFTFTAAAPEGASVKALHLHDDGTLVVLEKLRLADRDPRFLLRRVDLPACARATPCAAEAWTLEAPEPGGLNFEGLACDDGHCLLADDAGPQQRSQLVLYARPKSAR